MTIGHITADGHARIQIVVEDSNEGTHDVEALLDTGFNGALALPAQPVDYSVASAPSGAHCGTWPEETRPSDGRSRQWR
ncbi:putative aspartyl protease [Salinibacter ruber]|uniref:Aspartyl protease n=1 Tax=Salinibacter ruber TaxID=146919 RepID=A0A9X2QBW2_9BACT|nr:putative aspartyl protease [Salinibacter ruber]MCS3712145.1 putative aspartyl protease [Salinibacter ruber]